MCKKVPAEPASSFYEALQSIHFVSYCLSVNPFRYCHQQFQLGHPDRYLYSYYKNDIEKGLLTKERAQLLLDCLGIQINMRVPNGLSSGYMVGGRDENGDVVANELTEMLMQVVEDIRLVYPSVGLCYTKDTPDYFLQKACEILSHGRSHPAIFNDDIITKGLIGYGVPENEARSYIHSTCVEITPVASSNVWVASPYTNMAELLLDTMTREYDSFEMHVSALLEKLDNRIKNNFTEQNNIRKHRAEHSMNPLLSCFVNDCLSLGTDIERGGARYNWIMPSFVGMANLVDSLYVLKKIIYEEKQYTVCALKEILDHNFEGHESLRLHLLNDLPKYGNDNDEIDRYFGMITDHIIAECKKHTAIHSAGQLIPSVFCWVMHEYFGRNTGATPDGRSAGFPLGDGSGPCQGREMNGPTASILSSTKWEHHELIGGVAVNMKFSKSSLGKDSLNVMQSLIKAYMLRGGFEIQINVTDKALLEKARKNPEAYQDLVVRIGGYSDYFTRLSPEMQTEVILRTEHRL
jgi:formate C-acetyltransferase